MQHSCSWQMQEGQLANCLLCESIGHNIAAKLIKRAKHTQWITKVSGRVEGGIYLLKRDFMFRGVCLLLHDGLSAKLFLKLYLNLKILPNC